MGEGDWDGRAVGRGLEGAGEEQRTRPSRRNQKLLTETVVQKSEEKED